MPKRLRLDDLKALLDRMPATETHFAATGVAILDTELRTHNEANAYLRVKPRWFSSRAWTGPIRAVVLSQIPPARPWTSEQKDRCGFVAMACVMVVRELMARLTISLLLIGPCLALLIGIQATAPFQGSHALLGIIWVDVLATIGIVMSAFVQMDRDETLSLITDTDPGHIAWNFDLVSKVAVYVLLPLLILFASQFPGIGTSIADLFRSVPRVGP